MPHRSLRYFPLAVLLAAASCSDQGEGERCDINSGTDNTKDCKSGLICVSYKDLLDQNQGDRCCPETVTASTDARCRRGANTPNAGGAGGTGAAGAGGEAAGGEAGSPGAGTAAGAGAGGEAPGETGGEAPGGTAGTDSGGAGGAGP